MNLLRLPSIGEGFQNSINPTTHLWTHTLKPTRNPSSALPNKSAGWCSLHLAQEIRFQFVRKVSQRMLRMLMAGATERARLESFPASSRTLSFARESCCLLNCKPSTIPYTRLSIPTKPCDTCHNVKSTAIVVQQAPLSRPKVALATLRMSLGSELPLFADDESGALNLLQRKAGAEDARHSNRSEIHIYIYVYVYVCVVCWAQKSKMK